ncbi:MAG: acetyl-CoA carboxylase carboxyltransferase subunit alpha [Alphaproteobacteria bacterium]|nr:acetyl-CoA carboxylase carboxyltransferase subunit alpha [Alphaproteobacteria bacterium]
MSTYLEFEKPIAEIETKAAELRRLAEATPGMDVAEEASKLDARAAQMLKDTYAKLTPWQKAQVARHPGRPHFYDYARSLIADFTPLAGDRGFGDDNALVAGLGRFRGRSVAVLGHEKGNDTKSRLKHNFGMATPEGYRKAIRVMDLADKFDLPVISLPDTPGAYPGLVSEERGVAEAIARSTDRSLSLSVPMICVVTGEGMSGGAIAIAAGNSVMMLEHAIYAVITPEGCASILWRTADKAAEAANAMKITAQDLLSLKVIDRVIPEPLGGAHRDPEAAVKAVGDAIEAALAECNGKDGDTLKRERREKFLRMGRSLAA